MRHILPVLLVLGCVPTGPELDDCIAAMDSVRLELGEPSLVDESNVDVRWIYVYRRPVLVGPPGAKRLEGEEVQPTVHLTFRITGSGCMVSGG